MQKFLYLCRLNSILWHIVIKHDGNQFVARIWRTTQKDENTTQKRILDYLKNYPKATRQEVAIALGDLTEDGVKFNIGLLQQYGVLQRKGGRKEGEWVVLID